MKPTTSITIISSLPDETEQPLINWLAKDGWCKTIEVKQKATEAQLRALRELGFDIVMTMPAHLKTRAKSNHGQEELADEKRNMPYDTKLLIEPLIRVFDGDASQVKWQCFVEEDSAGVAMSQQVLAEKPKTYQAAYQLREKRIDELLEVANEFPDIQLYAVAGFATTAHALMRRKQFAQVNLERTNDDIDDIQTGIAFMRGAARQYDKPWGIDFSLWWGPIFGTVGDLPASYHRRNLYLSYFAGAKELVMEGIGAECDKMPEHIPPVARVVEEIGKFAQRHPAGKVDAPVAVLLPEDHGWMTSPYWDGAKRRWNYAQLAGRPGDKGIDGFFGMAFPGSVYTMDPFPFGQYESDDPKATPFALSCITPEFASSQDDIFDAYSPLPFGQFHDRNAARQWMHDNQKDTSEYRPMANSRWGDIFDVLMTTASAEVFQQYPLLVLLGAVTLDSSLKQKLCNYVKAGGKLVCAAGAATPDDSDLTGLIMQPHHQIGSAWRQTDDNSATWNHEALRYVPAQMKDKQTTSIHITEASGDPLVTEHKLGKGRVWTSLCAFYEGANTDLAGPATALFDQVIAPLQPWQLIGMPIQWLSTRSENTRTLVLSNNSAQPWTGTVRYRDTDFKTNSAVELTKETKIEMTNANENIKITLDPWDIAALRLYDNERKVDET